MGGAEVLLREGTPRLRSDDVRSAHGPGDCLVVTSAHCTISVAGWCAASEQPPHESVKNALSDHLLSRVRQRYVRAPRRTRGFSGVRKLARAQRSGGPADVSTGVVAVRRHRRAAAAGLGAVPPAVLRQHRRPARAADDQRRRRHPGLRDHAVVVLRRSGRCLRAGAAGRARPVRRRDRRRRRPSHAGPGRQRRAVDGVDRPCRAGVPRPGVAVGALRLHRGAVRLLRGQQPGAQRDGAAPARQGAAARGRGAEHGVVQPRLHLRPGARRARHPVARVRGGVRHRRGDVLGRLLRAAADAEDAADGEQPAGRAEVGRRRAALPQALARTCG